MALRYWPILVLSTVSAVSPSAYSQIGSGNGGGVGGGLVSYSYSEFIRDGKGIPFSAEFDSTTVRTLADGTHITQQQKRFEARDSQGRTRNETYLPDYLAKERNQPTDQPMFITIADPVSGKHIHLNPQQKTAMVNSVVPILPDHLPQKMPAAQPIQSVQARMSGQTSVEKLGGKTIDGVYAEGTRTTRVYPVGTQGNDRDITVVSERWISPELGVDVLDKTSDPRNGESTSELQNLNRAEPDPALFQIPADYKVQSQPHPTRQE